MHWGIQLQCFVAEWGAHNNLQLTTCLPADSSALRPVMRAPGREPQGTLGPPHPQPPTGRRKQPSSKGAGCCSLRVPRPPRKRPPTPGPGGLTVSSATQPMTWQGTCPAASTAVTPSARRACGSWTQRPRSSAGSPAHSAARAHPRLGEGWPCWTSTWPPSWPSRQSGSWRDGSPGCLGPSKAVPPPSHSSRPASAPP